jgi:hypothetical protein
MYDKSTFTKEVQIEFLDKLKKRFEGNMFRHQNLNWEDIEGKIVNSRTKFFSLYLMDITGGEPDLIEHDDKSKFIYYDLAKETPIDRRNLCYDNEALEKRKKFKPENSAVSVANAMGVELLTEDDYFFLQSYGEFDTKTSSWLLTPKDIRVNGGAIFGDRRFGRVFIYHNGADSYYGVRGFRAKLQFYY